MAQHRRRQAALLAVTLATSGCAPRALRTPPVVPSVACPPSGGRLVGLLGFDDTAVLVPLASHLEELLTADGFRVERRRRGATHDLDLAIGLDDFHPDIVSGATARRWTNIYFLSTALAAWMIPVMGAFDHSTVGLEARLTMTDLRAGRTLWQGSKSARNDERPSGMPGENDEHYVGVRLDRVGSDLAAGIHDELCLRLRAP
jgi:hypothetical protein